MRTAVKLWRCPRVRRYCFFRFFLKTMILSARSVSRMVASTFALGRGAPGYDADIVLLDASDWRYLAYHLGGNQVDQVIRGGRPTA